MAVEAYLTFTRRTGVANADLSAKQFYAVSTVSGGKIGLANAGKAIDGILQDNPTANMAGTYAASGVTKAAIAANQTLTAGVTLLEVAAGGTLTPVAAGTAVAKALESLTSVAAVAIVSVELLPSNAAFV